MICLVHSRKNWIRIGDPDDKVFATGLARQKALEMIVMEYLKSTMDNA